MPIFDSDSITDSDSVSVSHNDSVSHRVSDSVSDSDSDSDSVSIIHIDSVSASDGVSHSDSDSDSDSEGNYPREKNTLYFYAVEEHEDDQEKDEETVKKILTEDLDMDVNIVQEVSRVGEFSNDTIRPIKVAVNGPDTDEDILVRYRKLKTKNRKKDIGTLNRIVIASRLTKNTDLFNKDLLKHMWQSRDEFELKHVSIKDGKVIQMWPGMPTIVLYDPIMSSK
jgi:hypothetical protein